MSEHDELISSVRKKLFFFEKKKEKFLSMLKNIPSQLVVTDKYCVNGKPIKIVEKKNLTEKKILKQKQSDIWLRY